MRFSIFSLIMAGAALIVSAQNKKDQADSLNTAGNIPAQTVRIDYSDIRQKLTGWGISISWWAHDVGDKFPEKDLRTFVQWLTSPEELNMNVFRYNISGGDNPKHAHMRKDAQIPGYKTAADSAYNWSADGAQRRLLLLINEMRPDALYEAANYSPPYWMTKSGCSAGTPDGSDNLKDDCYDSFARYLADCVEYYKKYYGITFKSISPVNEPFSNWWKENGSQEGCAFGLQNQERIIKELYKVLKEKDMLGYTSIAVMDANSLDECVTGLEYYKTHGLLKYIGQINTHSYFGSKRKEISGFAKQNKIRLWQSESGPLNVNKAGLDNFLFMCRRIVTDMNELQPEVWCDWQYMGAGLGGVWSLVGYNVKEQIYERTKGFYCRKQFTRFIEPGYRFIGTTDENILAALSPDKKRMVVVIVNQDDDSKCISLDTGKKKIKHVQMYRTSEKENCEKVDVSFNMPVNNNLILEPKSVSTVVFDMK